MYIYLSHVDHVYLTKSLTTGLSKQNDMSLTGICGENLFLDDATSSGSISVDILDPVSEHV